MGMFFLLPLILIAAIVLWAIGLYNSLVGLRQQVKNAWSQIDVQLKRRYDLIPNLVETVKGYAKHERGTLEAVVQARNAAVAAQGVANQAQAENVLTGALRQLFALSERYPDLKANQNFLALQEELASTENKIGFSRQYYNDAAMRYKNRVETFPSNPFASAFGFAPEPFFELQSEAEKQPPQVKFS